MGLIEQQALNALFKYAERGTYITKTQSIRCPMWCDVGWRDTLSGYESVAAESITLISLLNKHVPHPQVNDIIQLNGKEYWVEKIDAQDDYITTLIVKSE